VEVPDQDALLRYLAEVERHKSERAPKRGHHTKAEPVHLKFGPRAHFGESKRGPHYGLRTQLGQLHFYPDRVYLGSAQKGVEREYSETEADAVRALFGGEKKAAAPTEEEKLRRIHPRVRRALTSFFESQGLPPNTPHAIGAGASMHLHGAPRRFKDIDLYVPGLEPKHVEEYHDGLEVDAHNNFFDAPFAKKVMKNRVHKGDLQLMSMADVLEMKRRLNRPKDQKDIRYLLRNLEGKKTAEAKAAPEVVELSTPEHLQQARDLEAQIFQNGPASETEGHRTFGVLDKEDLVAMTRVNPDPLKAWEGDDSYDELVALAPEAAISATAVSPEFQGKGLATALRNHLKEEYRSLIAGVGPKSNRPAMDRLNAATGFKEILRRGGNTQYHWAGEGEKKASTWADLEMKRRLNRPKDQKDIRYLLRNLEGKKTAELNFLMGDMAAGKTTLADKLRAYYDVVESLDTGKVGDDGKYVELSQDEKARIAKEKIETLLAAHREGKRVLVEGVPSYAKRYADLNDHYDRIVHLEPGVEVRRERLAQRAKERGSDLAEDIQAEQRYRDKGAPHVEKFREHPGFHQAGNEEAFEMLKGPEKTASETTPYLEKMPKVKGRKRRRKKRTKKDKKPLENMTGKSLAKAIRGVTKEKDKVAAWGQEPEEESHWLRNSLMAGAVGMPGMAAITNQRSALPEAPNRASSFEDLQRYLKPGDIVLSGDPDSSMVSEISQGFQNDSPYHHAAVVGEDGRMIDTLQGREKLRGNQARSGLTKYRDIRVLRRKDGAGLEAHRGLLDAIGGQEGRALRYNEPMAIHTSLRESLIPDPVARLWGKLTGKSKRTASQVAEDLRCSGGICASIPGGMLDPASELRQNKSVETILPTDLAREKSLETVVDFTPPEGYPEALRARVLAANGMDEVKALAQARDEFARRATRRKVFKHLPNLVRGAAAAGGAGTIYGLSKVNPENVSAAPLAAGLGLAGVGGASLAGDALNLYLQDAVSSATHKGGLSEELQELLKRDLGEPESMSHAWDALKKDTAGVADVMKYTRARKGLREALSDVGTATPRYASRLLQLLQSAGKAPAALVGAGGLGLAAHGLTANTPPATWWDSLKEQL